MTKERNTDRGDVMKELSRRDFVATSSCLALAGAAWSQLGRPCRAVELPKRIKPKIRGLSMTAYSLKPHMKWWWGKRTQGELDILGFLDYCAHLGLDGAELTSYFFPEPLESTYVREVRRRAHVLGLDITGGAMGNNFSHPPNSETSRTQQEYCRKWIDHFADMGAPVVRVFASRGLPDQASDEQVIQNVIANLEVALPHAEKRGVMLGLENHDFVTNVDYLVRILDAIDSKWLGLIWDSANLAPTPDPYRDLSRIAPYAITAQVKVMTKVNGKHTPVDYARLISILSDAGYSGQLVLEYEEREDPYEAIPRFVEDVRRVLEESR